MITYDEARVLANSREYVEVIDKHGEASKDRAYIAWVFADYVQVFFLNGYFALQLVSVSFDQINRKQS